MGDTEERQEDVQRWTAKRRTTLILEILKGNTTIAEAARTHGLTVVEVERWKERFLAGAENALRSRPRDEEEQKDELIKRLERKVGRMALEIDIMQEAMKPYRPFDGKTSSE